MSSAAQGKAKLNFRHHSSRRTWSWYAKQVVAKKFNLENCTSTPSTIFHWLSYHHLLALWQNYLLEPTTNKRTKKKLVRFALSYNSIFTFGKFTIDDPIKVFDASCFRTFLRSLLDLVPRVFMVKKPPQNCNIFMNAIVIIRLYFLEDWLIPSDENKH